MGVETLRSTVIMNSHELLRHSNSIPQTGTHDLYMLADPQRPPCVCVTGVFVRDFDGERMVPIRLEEAMKSFQSSSDGLE